MQSPRAVFLNAALLTPMHARTDPDEAATRETIEPDGWLYTGDVAVADEEGHFFVVDRKKDMIITGGCNVYRLQRQA